MAALLRTATLLLAGLALAAAELTCEEKCKEQFGEADKIESKETDQGHAESYSLVDICVEHCEFFDSDAVPKAHFEPNNGYPDTLKTDGDRIIFEPKGNDGKGNSNSNSNNKSGKK